MSGDRCKDRFRSIACALLWVAATSVDAQNNAPTDERLLACDAIKDEAQRLACFNRVVEELRPEVVEESPPDAAPGSSSRTRATPPVATKNAEDVDGLTPRRDQPVEVVRPAVAPANTTDSPPVAAAVDADRGDKRDIDLTGNGIIVGVWENYDGRFTVELNNGVLWRETEGTRVGIPEVGDGVTVTRGVFGSYRMKIDGIARVAWVRPTE